MNNGINPEMIFALIGIVGKLRLQLLANGEIADLTPMEEAFLQHADRQATLKARKTK
jgi:hypothetical protein